jgi:hypothetical protein
MTTWAWQGNADHRRGATQPLRQDEVTGGTIARGGAREIYEPRPAADSDAAGAAGLEDLIERSPDVIHISVGESARGGRAQRPSSVVEAQ